MHALAFPRVPSGTILIVVAANWDGRGFCLGARRDGGDGRHVLELDAHVVHADGVEGVSPCAIGVGGAAEGRWRRGRWRGRLWRGSRRSSDTDVVRADLAF